MDSRGDRAYNEKQLMETTEDIQIQKAYEWKDDLQSIDPSGTIVAYDKPYPPKMGDKFVQYLPGFNFDESERIEYEVISECPLTLKRIKEPKPHNPPTPEHGQPEDCGSEGL